LGDGFQQVDFKKGNSTEGESFYWGFWRDDKRRIDSAEQKTEPTKTKREQERRKNNERREYG